MEVVITGGAGMIGLKLARELLGRGTLAGAGGRQHVIERLTLLDVAPPPDLPDDRRLRFVPGAVHEPAALAGVMTRGVGTVFHLAAVVSAGAEADFELGYRVNLDGTRAVLEACRTLAGPPRFVFASSLSVFGGDLPAVVGDGQILTPQTSYGAQKAMGELLVADYSRKGFVDGRSLRLPTVVVRPGRPNKAASTFASSIVREPLQGLEAVCPVSPDTMMPLLSPRRTVAAFVHAHELPPGAWGSNRTVMLPSVDVSVGEIAAAVGRAGGEAASRLIRWEPDPAIRRIVSTWPQRLDARRALAMGFGADASIDAIVQAFIEDDLPRRPA